jgi:hypothetical protein
VDAETEAQRNEMRMNFQLGAVECCHWCYCCCFVLISPPQFCPEGIKPCIWWHGRCREMREKRKKTQTTVGKKTCLNDNGGIKINMMSQNCNSTKLRVCVCVCVCMYAWWLYVYHIVWAFPLIFKFYYHNRSI